MELFQPLREAMETPAAWMMLAAGYLSGSIPFGLILALTVSKKDVREAGSGNIGATNVARVVGKKLGILTLVLDALKGAVPVLVCLHLAPLPDAQRVLIASCAGLCAFLGHCFPVWLRLRGGKGVATGVGVLLALMPLVGLVGLVAFGLTFAVAKKVSVGSLTGAAVVMVAMPFMVERDLSLLVVVTMFVILVARHKSNIQRLLNKQELKV